MNIKSTNRHHQKAILFILLFSMYFKSFVFRKMSRIKKALMFLSIMKYSIYIKILILKYNLIEITPGNPCTFKDLGQEEKFNNEAPSVFSVLIHCSSSVSGRIRKD